MTWLRIIWEAFKRERRRQRMWKNRTAYTWHREALHAPDPACRRNTPEATP